MHYSTFQQNIFAINKVNTHHHKLT